VRSAFIHREGRIGRDGDFLLRPLKAQWKRSTGQAGSWILDLKDRKIRVNAIAPGPIRTPGLEGLVPAEHTEGLLGELASVVPMGHLGKPEEIAKAVLFLASSDSSFVNGAELFVDGGLAQIQDLI